MSEERRWSDERLEELQKQFKEHLQVEEEERRQQQEMYDAMFRLENKDKNISPGLVQLMTKTAGNVETLRIAADRQRTFIGGVLFAITAIWFFITDIGPLLADKLRKVF